MKYIILYIENIATLYRTNLNKLGISMGMV